MPSSDCIVCCEKQYRFIICNYCNYESCMKCTHRYLLESYKDPNCMNCHKIWSHDFMIENFTQKFITKEYKKHREDILLDRELSMLPITQPYIERENQIHEIGKNIRILQEKMNELRFQQNDLINENRIMGASSSKTDTLTYINRCCIEDCNGFIGKNFKCGICNTQICSECHCKLDENHECDKNTVETIKLLVHDTKSCPKCYKPITKNGGCSQVCCTGCYCVFDWKTGHITTDINHIHNPYYYQWLDQQAQQGRANEYGEILQDCILRLPTYMSLQNVIKSSKLSTNDSTYILNVHRFLQHIIHVELQNNVLDPFAENFELRKKYLKNQIEKEKFKFLIQKREKASKKRADISAIFHLLEETGRELMHKYIHDKNIESFKKDIKKIIEYCNSGFSKTNVKFGGVVPHINDDTLLIS